MPIFKGRWAAKPQIPEGLLHVDHRPVLVRDLHGLRRLLLLVLVGLRSGLVPGGLCPWRPGGGQAEGARCVCGQHQGLHLLLPLQPGDPAHDRLRRSSNYGAVLDGDHRDEPAEHLGGGDPGRNSSCGFWSNKTLLYFPLSVRSSVRPFVTGVTYQLFSIF